MLEQVHDVAALCVRPKDRVGRRDARADHDDRAPRWPVCVCRRGEIGALAGGMVHARRRVLTRDAQQLRHVKHAAGENDVLGADEHRQPARAHGRNGLQHPAVVLAVARGADLCGAARVVEAARSAPTRALLGAEAVQQRARAQPLRLHLRYAPERRDLHAVEKVLAQAKVLDVALIVLGHEARRYPVLRGEVGRVGSPTQPIRDRQARQLEPRRGRDGLGVGGHLGPVAADGPAPDNDVRYPAVLLERPAEPRRLRPVRVGVGQMELVHQQRDAAGRASLKPDAKRGEVLLEQRAVPLRGQARVQCRVGVVARASVVERHMALEHEREREGGRPVAHDEHVRVGQERGACACGRRRAPFGRGHLLASV
eukprot:Unigene9061_Nuclearia_a/m.27716 Unigene9061_Nuclearia_a/g.27716  ORF Unigene9061_Nuclearia_a/g.27716 Unigene9061_Nuclearia_a/m.27716 type:complete len:369 (-) Unigene9061_Nuclearia_a:30-1136(-)